MASWSGIQTVSSPSAGEPGRMTPCGWSLERWRTTLARCAESKTSALVFTCLRIVSAMSGSDAAKFRQAVNNPQLVEKMMSTPQAKALYKKLSGGK